MTSADARMALREATRPRHDVVDQVFAAFDLSQASGYRRFLAAQARAFLPIEAEIDASDAQAFLEDWPARRRADLLRADLSDLGITDVTPVQPPQLNGEAAVLGAIYVLEGSRLGGAMLRRNVAPELPARFLNAPGDGQGWRRLIAILEARLTTAADHAAAVAAANAVFLCFEKAGRSAREWKIDGRAC